MTIDTSGSNFDTVVAVYTLDGDTWTEVTRWLLATHPATAWALAAAWAALCVWLVPHFLLTGVDWRWLLWLAVVFIAAALGTYGLLTAGLLTTP